VPEYIEHIRGTASQLVPEIVLIGTACVLFFIGPFMVSDSGEAVRGLRRRCALLSLAGLVVAWLIWAYGSTEIENGTLFRIDHLVWITRGSFASSPKTRRSSEMPRVNTSSPTKVSGQTVCIRRSLGTT